LILLTNNMPFRVKVIEPQSRAPLGLWLREEREGRGWTLEKAARETRILKKHLSAMEEERFESLPLGLVRRNFVRSYIMTLGGNPERFITAREENSAALVAPTVHPPIGVRRIITATHLTFIGLALAGVGIIAYLGFQVRTLLKSPPLALTSPTNGFVTTTPVADVEGVTSPDATVSVNGKTVLKESSGHFKTQVDLERGANTVTIQTTKKYSHQRVETRTVLFE